MQSLSRISRTATHIPTPNLSTARSAYPSDLRASHAVWIQHQSEVVPRRITALLITRRQTSRLTSTPRLNPPRHKPRIDHTHRIQTPAWLVIQDT
eukprot:2325448-Rhodomonas_salina.2